MELNDALPDTPYEFEIQRPQEVVNTSIHSQNSNY